MDVLSHALIGKIISFFDKKANFKFNSWWVIFFSIAPDLVLIPFFLILGKEKERFLWIAQNVDWAGATTAHNLLSATYNTTHSLFFLFLIILPIIFYFNLPKSCFFAYLSHIIIDVFTHNGEWAIKIFYPLNYQPNGFTNAWEWSFYSMVICWIILSLIIFLQNKKFKK